MHKDDLPIGPLSAAMKEVLTVEGASDAEDHSTISFLRSSDFSLATVVLGLFDQSDDCIKVVGTDGALQFMNCNGKKAMQIDDFSKVHGMAWPDLWPDAGKIQVRSALAKALSGQIARFEAFCPTYLGEPRWWEVTVSPLENDSGGVQALLSTSRDITDRVRREEAAIVVSLEMKHRLRNAHSIGAALLLASGQAEQEHLEFARTVAARLGRLAEVHAKLVDVGGGIALSSLCSDVVDIFDQSGGRLQCDNLPDVQLDEERARALSLILGELTTNSLKYGALGRGGTASLGGSVESGCLLLDWHEAFDNSSRGSFPLSSGQGTALMARIAGLYRGSITAGPDDGGYRAEIRLPL